MAIESVAPARAPQAAAGTKGTVLVVDDDPTVLDIVSGYLDRAGYAVRVAGDGEQALRLAAEAVPDLVVLDVVLPRASGFDVMQRLRTDGAVSVILLSAKVLERDRINGLRLGADDYVAKPFSPDELVARVTAVLRRVRETQAARREPIRFPELTIDDAARRVFVRGEEVALTLREYELLLFLAQHPGMAFSRSHLMETVWRCGFYSDTRTVPVHIRRLRQKIEQDPSSPRSLQTVWGVGYRYQP